MGLRGAGRAAGRLGCPEGFGGIRGNSGVSRGTWDWGALSLPQNEGLF